EERRVLGSVGAASFGQRLYACDDIRLAIGASAARRRILAAAYPREVARLSGWAAQTLARAEDPAAKRDERLEASMTALRDDLAWFWAIAAVGAALDGDSLSGLDALLTVLPDGVPLDSGGHLAGPRAQAERTAIALG